MKVLNLYCGIGGNRKLWKDVEVTAVENNPNIAMIYKDFFPCDEVIVADAHKYLLEHFEEFDFIWSSPPCPSHSKIRNVAGVGSGQNKPIYPDMKLYEEIIFLQQIFMSSGTKFKGRYVVENVESYYKPLIKPQILQRHYFWTNFFVNKEKFETDNINLGNVKLWQEHFGFNLDSYKGIDKTKALRNCVNPNLGKHIFECSIKEKQTSLFCEEI